MERDVRYIAINDGVDSAKGDNDFTPFCNSFDGSQHHYRCAKYKSNTGNCTAHFIREETLKKIVWKRIFDVTKMFYDDIP